MCLEARLITSPGELIASRVYFLADGIRRWVPNANRLPFYGLSLETTEQWSASDILAIPKGGDLPFPWTECARRNPPADADSAVMREIACCTLSGDGTEFGAGAHPNPVPVGCRPRYADYQPIDTLVEIGYSGNPADYARLDLLSDIQAMDGIGDESLDFIIASHVIEHVPNPLRTLQTAHRKLRPGGQFVLVVPDMLRTFDRDRKLTELDHLISDFESPDPRRDLDHYREFFTLVFPTAESDRERTAIDSQQAGRDIHFHTWTFESFHRMYAWATANLARWTAMWSHPGSAAPDANEFYFVLTK